MGYIKFLLVSCSFPLIITSTTKFQMLHIDLHADLQAYAILI